MTDEATFITSSPQSLTHQGNGKVIVQSYVVIKEGAQVIYSMDAEFDFAQIPAEHHSTVARWLIANRHSLALRRYEPPATVSMPSTPAAALVSTPRKKWWKFWSKS